MHLCGQTDHLMSTPLQRGAATRLNIFENFLISDIVVMYKIMLLEGPSPCPIADLDYTLEVACPRGNASFLFITANPGVRRTSALKQLKHLRQLPYPCFYFEISTESHVQGIYANIQGVPTIKHRYANLAGQKQGNCCKTPGEVARISNWTRVQRGITWTQGGGGQAAFSRLRPLSLGATLGVILDTHGGTAAMLTHWLWRFRVPCKMQFCVFIKATKRDVEQKILSTNFGLW